MATDAAISARCFRVGYRWCHFCTPISKRALPSSTRGLCPIAAAGSATAPNRRFEYHSVSRQISVRGGSREMRAMIVVLSLRVDDHEDDTATPDVTSGS